MHSLRIFCEHVHHLLLVISCVACQLHTQDDRENVNRWRYVYIFFVSLNEGKFLVDLGIHDAPYFPIDHVTAEAENVKVSQNILG